jgi:MerR family transcriptional regulator, light-induced transcriptional regulator
VSRFGLVKHFSYISTDFSGFGFDRSKVVVYLLSNLKSHRLPLQAVVRATGLSAHLLRAWEKRYGAVQPVRSQSGHRHYTEADVQRLLLLKRATATGHPIRTIARRSNAEIRELINPRQSARASAAVVAPEEELLEKCVAAVRAMDQPTLGRTLDAALVRFGHQGTLQRVVAPLAEEIGVLWRSGEITAAHEHFFTAVARSFLGSSVQQFALSPDAPALIAATPVGQHHELGAFMAAVTATNLGWRAIYLGCSLPAAEIAAAAIQLEARVLVLSIIHPPDDSHLAQELRAIRRRLPDINLLVGGRASDSYRRVLRGIKAQVITDLMEFGDALDAIRARSTTTNR